MSGERLVDELLGDVGVGGFERRVPPRRRRTETQASRRIHQVMQRASPAAARLANEPARGRVDERRAGRVAA